MAIDLVPEVDATARPWRRLRDGAQVGIGRMSAGRPAIAMSALFTAAKVTLACIAILVVLPAVMAAQGAIAR